MDTQKDIMEQEARGTGSIVSKDDKLPDSKLTGENLPSSVPEAQGQDARPPEDTVIEPDEMMEQDDPETLDPSMLIDGQDMSKGAKLSFTFRDGLVVQVLPNGDIVQEIL